ncbi:unnamed protein product [Oppiella nova]|uniref:Uncharacterized protein n=1 Tax=Oppiella nova TaxID=334625 RepID=A0A7R9MH56_9ACAR|nr:unnamed protein product [Oppiella nova]CAG2176147.1 unnamed protein product [Oppiella nova]
MSSKMITIVSQFAYNNQPLAEKTANIWREFSEMSANSVSKAYRVIDYGLTREQMSGVDLKTYECDSLWKPFITSGTVY